MVFTIVDTQESEMIAAASRGEEAALSWLYTRYQPLVLGYLIRLLGSVPLAEDLCQDSFLKAFRALKSYRGEASFKNWLFMIVKNRVADHWKQHYSQLTVSLEEWIGSNDEPIELDEAPPNVAAEDAAKALLAQLPPDYRSVLEYRFLHGYSIKETAEALHISESNAKIRQYRALLLAKQLTHL